MQEQNNIEKRLVKLRPYQAKAVESVLDKWYSADRLLGVAPTGAGKTVMFSAVTKAVVEAGGRVLIMAHREELLDQTIDKLHKATGIIADKEKAEHRGRMSAKVVVGSVQSLVGNRGARFGGKHFSHVIVDECHHILADSYQKVLGRFDSKVLGLTATSDRTDKRNLGEYFQEVAFEISLLELLKEGYLIWPKTIKPSLEIDIREVRKTAGDFNVGDLDKTIDPLLEKAAKVIIDTAFAHNRRKILGFFPLRKTAEHISEILNDLGMPSGFVHGDDPCRNEKLAKFSNGEYQFLANAMLLTEGYDEPAIDMLVPMRPTQSRSLYCQMIGRGTRLSPGHIGGMDTKEERLEAISDSHKPDVIILDFPWLTDKLSLIKPSHLVAGSEEQAQRIEDLEHRQLNLGELLKLAEEEEKAEKAYAEAHARELAMQEKILKNAGKKTVIVDPVQAALDLDSGVISDYEPIAAWEFYDPTSAQLTTLEKYGVDIKTVTSRGKAKMLLDMIFDRQRLGLASPKMVRQLVKYKHPQAHTLTQEEAKQFLLKKWGKI